MEKEKNLQESSESCRLGKVGGQAVLEGVMMKADKRTVTSCRKADGSIVVTDNSFTSVREKAKILNLPIIRGVINFVEMMILSVKTLNASADALGLEEEETKFEKWLKKHFGLGITTFIMIVGVILGLGLSLVLFMFLPIFTADLINKATLHFFGFELGLWQKVLEGVLKMVIFILYLWLVSFMNDIKRTFMYHGAEHKTIACYEAGDELTPENAMKHKRFHPRCGTSFMFFMILLGVIAGITIGAAFPNVAKNKWAYMGIRLLILPLLMGIGYEFIRFAGKHDNVFTRVMSAPGLWVQKITTKEPTLDMLEVAIVSTKCALRDENSEWMEFFNTRAWEKMTLKTDDGEKTAEDTADLNKNSLEVAEETANSDENSSEVAECDAVSNENVYEVGEDANSSDENV